MKTLPRDALKIMLCKVTLGAVAMFAAAVLLAMVQGTAAPLPCVLLLLVCLAVLNALCGLLAPAPHTGACVGDASAGRRSPCGTRRAVLHRAA